jgi:hypothetical protein
MEVSSRAALAYGREMAPIVITNDNKKGWSSVLFFVFHDSKHLSCKKNRDALNIVFTCWLVYSVE